MADFDAELYLRLKGEDGLVGDPHARHHAPWGSPLLQAARALVAVGAIDAEGAQALIEDYDRAGAVRAEGWAYYGAPGGAVPAVAVEPLTPRRVVACDREIEQPWGTMVIRAVSLAERSTRVAVTLRGDSATRSSPSRYGRMMPFGGGSPWAGGALPQFQLADDRGTTTITHFSGGGSDYEWEGHLHADRPLATDTAWIDVDGARIELDDDVAPSDVTVERLPEQDPALRYLWRSLAMAEHVHAPPENLDEGIRALVAAGALAPDDPTLKHVKRVRLALDGAAGSPGGGGRLPEPWRSLLARRMAADGPSGRFVIGAVTPLLDGIGIGVSSLESTAEGFRVEVDVVPGTIVGPFSSLSGGGIEWWAADDRGNHYLGQFDGWSGAEDHTEGTLQFWPALDPKAARLELMPTAETTRAVIAVSLPWAEADT